MIFFSCGDEFSEKGTISSEQFKAVSNCGSVKRSNHSNKQPV